MKTPKVELSSYKLNPLPSAAQIFDRLKRSFVTTNFISGLVELVDMSPINSASPLAAAPPKLPYESIFPIILNSFEILKLQLTLHL